MGNPSPAVILLSPWPWPSFPPGCRLFSTRWFPREWGVVNCALQECVSVYSCVALGFYPSLFARFLFAESRHVAFNEFVNCRPFLMLLSVSFHPISIPNLLALGFPLEPRCDPQFSIDRQVIYSSHELLGEFWSLGKRKISLRHARTGRLTRSFCTCRLLWVIETCW